MNKLFEKEFFLKHQTPNSVSYSKNGIAVAFGAAPSVAPNVAPSVPFSVAPIAAGTPAADA